MWSTLSGVLLYLVHGIVNMLVRGVRDGNVLQRCVGVGHLLAEAVKLGVRFGFRALLLGPQNQ